MADPHRTTPSGKPRARSLAIPFAGSPGRWHAVTDVPGVEVGYTTLVEGDSVRTGVTALHPRGADHPGDPVAAGFFSQNGNGEMTGVSWIEESGTFTGPVAITNTHAVGATATTSARRARSTPSRQPPRASRESRSGSCWPTTTRWRLARTGTTGSHFSGDLFLAFSVANQGGLSPSFATLRGDGAGSYDHLDLIPWGFLDPFSEAVVQGVEEAVANALVANEDMVGYRGHRTPALPRDRVAAVFESTR